MITVGLLLACGGPPAPPPYEGIVQVAGIVHGWDGTGDVAVEACGAGTLVEADNTFVTELDSACELRLVWERDGARALGPWTALHATGPVVGVALTLPPESALEPLPAEALAERQAIIDAAIDQLEASPEAPAQSVRDDW